MSSWDKVLRPVDGDYLLARNRPCRSYWHLAVQQSNRGTTQWSTTAEYRYNSVMTDFEWLAVCFGNRRKRRRRFINIWLMLTILTAATARSASDLYGHKRGCVGEDNKWVAVSKLKLVYTIYIYIYIRTGKIEESNDRQARSAACCPRSQEDEV